jgi:hypothetical protein
MVVENVETQPLELCPDVELNPPVKVGLVTPPSELVQGMMFSPLLSGVLA